MFIVTHYKVLPKQKLNTRTGMQINYIINFTGIKYIEELKQSYQASHITHNRQNIYAGRYLDTSVILKAFCVFFSFL